MNMQQMMIQAQRIKRELDRALNDLKEKEFSVNKGGAVTITMRGDKVITKIDIDKDALAPENKDMIEDLIKMGINELQNEISEAEVKINERITGQKGGLPF